MKTAVTIRTSDIDYKPYLIIFDIIDNGNSFMVIRNRTLDYSIAISNMKYDKKHLVDYDKFIKLSGIDDLILRIKNIKQDAIMRYLIDLDKKDIFDLIKSVFHEIDISADDLYKISHIIGSQTNTSV